MVMLEGVCFEDDREAIERGNTILRQMAQVLAKLN